MERPKKPALRRPETKTTTVAAMDVRRMSSSLNMSSSSLRSSGGADVDRRTTTATVRFAPTPTTLSSSSSSSATRRAGSSRAVSSSSSSSQQARPATARPASVAGTRGMRSLHGGSPATLGPKGLRRSWGWGTGGSGGGGGDGEEKEGGDHRRRGDAVAVAGEVKAPVRSSSVPRRIPADQDKQHPKRETKTKITSNSKTKAVSGSPPKAGEDVSMDRRIPNTAASKTTEKAPRNVSLNNMVRQSPPRKTTPATIGASWESLPSDLQSIGLEVMSYRDAAEVAAIEALQEASSAEILLRAFADLAAVAAEMSPQQTVDEFLALEATLARSAAAGHAEDWLRAAVSSDLGRFSLYSAVSPTSQPEEEAGRRRTTWLGAAAREVGEETRGWFVGHVERLIDGDAAGTLGQLKRVNDWLDGAPPPPSEAAERLRKKIFGYLLDHVESAVLALNGGAAAGAHGRRK
ncbi:hypothetical protein OsI_35736 [Oryza sativa Indica Group]|uniref:DUF6857 domain-containing protein n=1 Tax=Oryza sativa subsp. indica TaxID=39946 RepID=A2ZD71_ORYSI|nr:hypothetical protein OsI_35736 [Oryza sativa Indica Group]